MRFSLLTRTVILFFCVLFNLSCRENNHSHTLSPNLDWTDIQKDARGKTVNFMMWKGDPQINRYMEHYVVPNMKKDYDIDLKIIGAQGSAIVSMVMSEKEAGAKTGAVDMCWINGETFYQLREINGLYGPFVNRLPNAVLIDFSNPFIGLDFQMPVDNMECPWGNVQQCLIYNSDRVHTPPENMTQLEEYVKRNPGRFTIGTDFTGLTFLKSLLIALSGGMDSLRGSFNERKYQKYSTRLWEYINRIKPYFWKRGQTFPSTVAQMHQLFSQGELDFTMSNNDGEVDNKISEGVFPSYARSYVLDSGTIQNSHYLGIISNSPNPEAAMVVINFMISPKAQLEKQRSAVWGDGTILNLPKLPVEIRNQFDSLQKRKYGPSRSEIQTKALMELDPQYMIRMNDDFRKHVIDQ